MQGNSQIIIDVVDSIDRLCDRFQARWEAFGWSWTDSAQLTVNFSCPPLSANEVAHELRSAKDRVKQADLSDAGQGGFLSELLIRLDEYEFGNMNSNPSAFMFGILEFANAIFRQIPQRIELPLLPVPEVDWQSLKERPELLPRDLVRRLRSVETHLRKMEPRAIDLDQKITFIDAAYAVAEQLPTDLEEMRGQKADLSKLMQDAQTSLDSIKSFGALSEDGWGKVSQARVAVEEDIQKRLAAADIMIQRSEQALRGATSVGLAQAFEMRRNSLGLSQFGWTLGLVAALGCAWYVGQDRVEGLKEVLSGSKSASIVWANVLLAAIGIGAPLWFAWLSTKQIGTTFRLAEDYAFKASVSRAYEGYRAEAVDIDPVLRERLFATALTRIEEAPIRLVSGEAHSSPLVELLSRPGIKSALEAVPGIADKIIALIPTKAGTAAAIVAPATAIGAVAAAANGESHEERK